MKEYSKKATEITMGKGRTLGPSHTYLSLNITSVLDDACDGFPTFLMFVPQVSAWLEPWG